MKTPAPRPPEVSPETWQKLFAAVERFRQLQPWRWMGDNYALVIQESEGRPVRLLSVFGAVRQIFGLTLFCGSEGIATYLEYAALADGSRPDRDILFRQRSLNLELLAKSELPREDRALFTKLGYQPPKGPHAWPSFRSYRPGFYPWFIEQWEAEMMADDLETVSQFSRFFQPHPELVERYFGGLFPFYNPPTGPLITDGSNLEWRELLFPKQPLPPPIEIPAKQVQALLSLPKSDGLRLELDSFYAPAIVDEKYDRPYFGKIGLAVAADTGLVVNQCLNGPATSHEETIAESLLGACSRMKARPEKVSVWRPQLLFALGSLATALQIGLDIRTRLPGIEEMRAALERSRLMC